RQSAPEQPECGAAAGGPSPCGRGDPRPPCGGEGSQVGYLQATGREIISEPPRVAAGRFPGALAHNGVRQRPGDRQPPDRLPGDAQPPGELRGGQEIRGLLRFRWWGPSWCRDERRGQGSGQCLQQLGRDWLVCVVVVVYRVRFRGGFLVQGPCPLGDLGGWSRGPYFVPGFARAHCHGDGTPIRSGASGTKAAAGVPPGVSQYRLSRLICRRPTSAASGTGSRLTPHAGALRSGTGSTGTRWLGS